MPYRYTSYLARSVVTDHWLCLEYLLSLRSGAYLPHVQVLTPYEEARCHVEAWPHYPDALMISNMIAGIAPSPVTDHDKVDNSNSRSDVHKTCTMTGGTPLARSCASHAYPSYSHHLCYVAAVFSQGRHRRSELPYSA